MSDKKPLRVLCIDARTAMGDTAPDCYNRDCGECKQEIHDWLKENNNDYNEREGK